MVNASLLSLMSTSAVLINIARGAVVDESDLYQALRDKEIGGAVLDVWWNVGCIDVIFGVGSVGICFVSTASK